MRGAFRGHRIFKDCEMCCFLNVTIRESMIELPTLKRYLTAIADGKRPAVAYNELLEQSRNVRYGSFSTLFALATLEREGVEAFEHARYLEDFTLLAPQGMTEGDVIEHMRDFYRVFGLEYSGCKEWLHVFCGKGETLYVNLTTDPHKRRGITTMRLTVCDEEQLKQAECAAGPAHQMAY